MKHGEPAEAETHAAAHKKPGEGAAGGSLAGGVRPRAEQGDGEEQPQEVAQRAAIVQRRPPRAHGVAGEEQRGEKGARHRLYSGRAV